MKHSDKLRQGSSRGFGYLHSSPCSRWSRCSHVEEENGFLVNNARKRTGRYAPVTNNNNNHNNNGPTGRLAANTNAPPLDKELLHCKNQCILTSLNPKQEISQDAILHKNGVPNTTVPHEHTLHVARKHSSKAEKTSYICKKQCKIQTVYTYIDIYPQTLATQYT